MFAKYDLIVVGLGHAGAECAHAVARLGAKVLGIDPNRGFVKMSCNPAMGGIAKGQIVREIDALGGLSGIVSDSSTLQFRMLNRSKGPAVWSPRTQNDILHFAQSWQQALEATQGLDFWQDMVKEILIEKGQVVGVKTSLGIEIKSKAVVLTTGTFLNGWMYIGNKKVGGGRAGEPASTSITTQLQKLGFEIGRMKTGTSPRIDGRTLDYSKMEEQLCDVQGGKFSFLENLAMPLPKKSCYITYTNPKVHELVASGFALSPMFTGQIQAKGPRYCPSIEDKVSRFAHRERHQIFVEPMGVGTVQVYVNGFSTSLPEDVQYRALRAIQGFEHAKIFRPGYAITYDYFLPTQLKNTLETKLVENLYFAGQINGTTGYEEAACQGLMAGINVYRKIKEQAPFVLKRSQAYIGVLIDDLIHKGIQGDPYRMFTSRAEHRILLRQDNADLRLTEKGYEIGLASELRYKQVKAKKEAIQTLTQSLRKQKIAPKLANMVLEKLKSAPIQEKQNLYQLLKRPQVSMGTLSDFGETIKKLLSTYTQIVKEQVGIQIKYADYLKKEQALVDKMARLENCIIPKGYPYSNIKNLSTESREKLQKIQPATLGGASRISGVSPADIAVLIIYMGR